jgi:hypothetical protein
MYQEEGIENAVYTLPWNLEVTTNAFEFRSYYQYMLIFLPWWEYEAVLPFIVMSKLRI